MLLILSCNSLCINEASLLSEFNKKKSLLIVVKCESNCIQKNKFDSSKAQSYGKRPRLRVA